MFKYLIFVNDTIIYKNRIKIREKTNKKTIPNKDSN